jgi:hypothetical protein
MSTDTRRTAANRANAAFSTGPRSPHGKSVSSRNSTTHGLTSDTLVIFNWESQDAFNALQQAFHARFRPLDTVETILVDRMVDTTWRRNRAIGIETTLFDLDISAIEEDIIIQMPEEGFNGLLRLAWAFRERHGENSSIAIQRLISGLERSFSRARRELQILQKERFNDIPVDEILAMSTTNPEAQTPEPTEDPAASPKTIEMKKRTHFDSRPAPETAPEPQPLNRKEPGRDVPQNK